MPGNEEIKRLRDLETKRLRDLETEIQKVFFDFLDGRRNLTQRILK
jgi:hypothetical protein